MDDTIVRPTLITASLHYSMKSEKFPGFSAECYGGDFDWTLRRLQTNEDGTLNQSLLQRLWYIMCKKRTYRAYAPSPVHFNAEIIDKEHLTKRITVASGFDLYRNQNTPADGTFLERGEMGIISGAGCPVIVAWYREKFIFAHAGRDSLFDRKRILSGTPSRINESVVDGILKAFGYPEIDCEEIGVSVHFSISPQALIHERNHPTYGAFNEKMFLDLREWGAECAYHNDDSTLIHLNLPELIRRQFIKYGVPSKRIHLHETYVDEHPDLVHTRGPDRERRNLIIIVRH